MSEPKIKDKRRLNMAKTTKTKKSKAKGVVIGLVLAVSLTVTGILGYMGVKKFQTGGYQDWKPSAQGQGGQGQGQGSGAGGGSETGGGSEQTDQNGGTVTEITEAEYKTMVETKLENLVAEYGETRGHTYTNIQFKYINTATGEYGATGKRDSIDRIITVNVGDKLKADSYEEVYKNNISIEDVNSVKTTTDLSTQVTQESYNEFLDKVVTDTGFQQVLTNAGITVPGGISGWEDVATNVNAHIFNNATIEIKFVDWNNLNTVVVRVQAAIPPQATSPQKTVDEFNSRNKGYVFVSSADYSAVQQAASQSL